MNWESNVHRNLDAQTNTTTTGFPPNFLDKLSTLQHTVEWLMYNILL